MEHTFHFKTITGYPVDIHLHSWREVLSWNEVLDAIRLALKIGYQIESMEYNREILYDYVGMWN